MSTASKKLTSIFFLGLGVFPLLFMLTLTLKKQGIYIRMREKMEYQSLQTIVVPENEVVWMDKHEIWVNNKMFDISSRSLENGTYTFTGLYDEDETKLVEKEKNAAGENNDSKILAQLFKYLPGYCTPSGIKTKMDFYRSCRHSFIAKGPVEPYTEILTPPPNTPA